MRLQNNLIIISILIFAFLIRLIALNQSLWLDEAIQAWAIQTYSFKNLVFEYLKADFNPPLSHILTFVFVKFFGDNEIVLRLPSVLAGVGVVFFSYKILNFILAKHKNVDLIYFGILLVSLAPLLIFYSQEARPYSLAVFFSTWSMYEFLQIMILKNRLLIVHALKYFFATSLMFWSHYVAWFIWPTQLLLLCLFSYQDKKELSNKLKIIFLPLLSIILLLSILFSQLQIGQNTAGSLAVWQNLSTFSLRQLALIPTKILIGRLPLDFNLWTLLLLSIPFLLFGFLIIKTIKNKIITSFQSDTRNDTFYFFFLLAWLVIPVLLGIIVSLKVSVFTYFRFLYLAPAFYLLLIYCLKDFSVKKMEGIYIIFLVISAYCSFTYLFNPVFHREDWRSLVEFIKQRDVSSQVIILSEVSRPFWYYDRDKHQLIDYKEIEQNKLENKIWLIKYSQPIFEPDNHTEEKLVNNYGYEVVEEKHFQGDLVLKYLVNYKRLFAYEE
ncbi:hypothetical protein GYA19_05365 [Candidatus Beckwithbacteria bacterium]|nr:hypothetical protein [Candidatus Beckwithbacteria bacterium]